MGRSSLPAYSPSPHYLESDLQSTSLPPPPYTIYEDMLGVTISLSDRDADIEVDIEAQTQAQRRRRLRIMNEWDEYDDMIEGLVNILAVVVVFMNILLFGMAVWIAIGR